MNVSASDMTTWTRNSNHIFITNDKGHLSKKEINRMLKYKCVLTTLKIYMI